MTRVPDFDELVGADVPGSERERLQRVHQLLVQAGPPPELSPDLDAVPWPEDALSPLGFGRKRVRRSPLLLAAALVTAVVAGFLVGQVTSTSSGRGFDTVRVVQMTGRGSSRDATATLQLGSRDRNGNWPMLLRVENLARLPEGGYYDLYLTHKGRPIALCGSFNVERRGEVVVRLSAAYELGRFDGWVVTRQVPPNHDPTQIVLTSANAAA